MTSHDDFRTAEILTSETVWADPPDVLDAVLAEIDAAGTSFRRLWMPAAAVLVLVVAVAGFALTRPEPVDFTLAGTTLAPTATADVRVVETPAGIVLRLEVAGLPPADPGTYYQGWVVAGDRAVSVGTFHMRGGDGPVAFWSGVEPTDYPELIVTLQSETDGPVRSNLVVLTGRA